MEGDFILLKFQRRFTLHPTIDGFPDALAPSYVKRSDWNSREPAYTRIFTRCLRPVTGNKLRALKSHMLICPEIGIVFFYV